MWHNCIPPPFIDSCLHLEKVIPSNPEETPSSPKQIGDSVGKFDQSVLLQFSSTNSEFLTLLLFLHNLKPLESVTLNLQFCIPIFLLFCCSEHVSKHFASHFLPLALVVDSDRSLHFVSLCKLLIPVFVVSDKVFPLSDCNCSLFPVLKFPNFQVLDLTSRMLLPHPFLLVSLKATNQILSLLCGALTPQAGSKNGVTS